MECHSRKRERGRRASERLELMELDFARDLFPSILAARGTTSLPGWRPSPTEIHAVRLSGYWNDIGSPDQYFKGVADIASGQVRLIGDPAPLDTDPSGVIYWDDGRRALEEARGAARGRVIVLPADDPSLGGPCKL
jgi:NDP-sugar pyrophosphorylase family protein